MNTLEKVARAICLASITDPHTIDPGDLPGLINQWWPDSIPVARAALEAMLEPSEAQRLADAAFPRAEDVFLYADEFRSMIQAALDGK